MFFGMGLDLTKRSMRAQEAQFSMSEFAKDKTIFDSGAARGEKFATIPVSGTAPDGSTVEFRIIEENGGELTDWSAADPVVSGRWSGLLRCPLNWLWMRIEARVSNQPAQTLTTQNCFGVGHVVALWSGSSTTQFWSPEPSSEPSDPLPTIMDQVIDLKENRRSNGCQWTGEFRKPGVDPLPVGCTLSGLVVRINVDTEFEGWDFTGYLLRVYAVISMRNCIFGERDGATNLVTSLDFYETGGYEVIEYCDFIGPAHEDGQGLFLKMRDQANSMVEWPVFQRNRLWAYQSDAIKPNKGLVAFNFFDTQVNLNMDPLSYSETETYPAGTLVRTVNRHVFRALVDVTGIDPPTTKTGASEVWQNLDPHSDQITVDTCVGGCVIRGNYFNRDPAQRHHEAPGRGVTGVNNAIRLVRNNTSTGITAQYDKVTVEYNYITGALGAYPYPFQAKTGDNPNDYANPEIRHNLVMPPVQGDLIHPDMGYATVIWTDNQTVDGSIPEIPTNSVPGTTVAAQPDDMVQMLWHDRTATGSAGVRHAFIGADITLPPSCAALADGLMQKYPGDRLCFIHHTFAGSSLTDVVAGNDPARNWEDDHALHSAATGDGQSVGLACTDWPYFASGSMSNEGELISTFLSGKADDGSDISTPVTVSDPASGNSMVLNHLARELYDQSKTRWLLFNSELYGISEDMKNGRENFSGTSDAVAVSIEQARLAARALPSDERLQELVVSEVSEVMTYANQAPDADPQIGPDGALRVARLSAFSIGRGLSYQAYPLPEFDRSYWEPTGAYFEAWWSGGPITTTRLARQKPSLPASYSHWAEVFGFEINGAPSSSSEIIDGRVRIYPNAPQFVGSDLIIFGTGRGTGQVKYPEDSAADTWQDLPIADLGWRGIEGAAVRTLPNELVFENTLSS